MRTKFTDLVPSTCSMDEKLNKFGRGKSLRLHYTQQSFSGINFWQNQRIHIYTESTCQDDPFSVRIPTLKNLNIISKIYEGYQLEWSHPQCCFFACINTPSAITSSTQREIKRTTIKIQK